MKYKLPLLLAFALSLSKSYSQVDSPALYDNINISPTDSSKLLFSFYNLNFLRNNEYFDKIATGYTFFGSQLNPKIAYVPNPFMRIEGGVFIRKDFGNPNFTTIAPTFTLKLQKNDYSFLFGNLEGALNHRLIEPLFNYERIITNRLENGLQFKIDKKSLWLDTWIDWEKQIYQNSPFQEHITAGLSSKLTLVETGNDLNLLKIKIPVQAIIFHKGGQIDVDSTDILSLANTAAGLLLELDLSKRNGFIKSIVSDNYYVYYKDVSPAKHQAYISGNGTYFNLLINSRHNLNLMLSYWQGDYYIAPRGGYLYQSVSSIYGKINYTEDNRKLLMARIMYQKEILPNLFIDIRFEPYQDLNNHFLEFSYSAFASYKIDYSLGKKKMQ